MRAQRPRRRLAAALLLLAAAACGGSPPDADRQEPPTEDEPQADRPLLGPEAVTLAENFRLPPDLRLELPRDLAVDAAGSLYVLDFAPPTRILQYDSTGRFVGRMEDRNPQTGSGRIVSAIELALAPWNTLFVVDRGSNALTTFLTTTNTFTFSIEVTPGVALDVLPLPEFGEFYLHKWEPEQRRVAVLRMRMPFDSLGTAYEVRIPSGLSVREEARDVHFHTAVDGQGRLYVGFWDGYPVRVLGPGGETVRTIGLDRPAVPKGRELMAHEAEENLAVLREISPGVEEALLREAAQPDSVYALIEELTVDPTGRLWARTNRPDAAGATPYDVFNEEGQYLARVDVPGDVERTVFAPDGGLYVIVAPPPGAAAGVGRRIVGYEVRLGGP